MDLNNGITLPKHTIVLAFSGSTAYNLRIKTSDYDYRGCYLDEDWEKLLGIKSNDCSIEHKSPDFVMFNLIKFIRLALDGNTNVLEMLFVPYKYIIKTNSFGDYLIENSDLFINKKTLYCLAGYCTCEYKRALGDTTGKLGEKRKEEINNVGYSPKNASHCIRLLDRGIRLIQTGKYLVEYENSNPMREIILSLKEGKTSLETFKCVYNEMHNKFETLNNKNNIVDEPNNKNIIWKRVEEYLKMVISNKLDTKNIGQSWACRNCEIKD